MKKPPTFEELHTPRPYAEWHEDHGPVLWHHMPIDSPPYCGDPLSMDWPWIEEEHEHLWWTPLPDCERLHESWERQSALKAANSESTLSEERG